MFLIFTLTLSNDKNIKLLRFLFLCSWNFSDHRSLRSWNIKVIFVRQRNIVFFDWKCFCLDCGLDTFYKLVWLIVCIIRLSDVFPCLKSCYYEVLFFYHFFRFQQLEIIHFISSFSFSFFTSDSQFCETNDFGKY